MNEVLNIAAVAVLALGAVVFTATATIWHLYMFQMNHYIHPDHWRWMFHAPRNLRSVFPPLLAALAAVLIKDVAVGRLAAGGLLFAGAFLALGGFRKLKYTRRVNTLIVTNVIVEALIVWGLFAAGLPLAAAVAAGCALIPWLIMLSDWIDWPIEHGFRAYYIRDAKQLLARNPDLVVVGVTGSYGKTSMKYFLSSLLGIKYNVLMPPGSCNTPMGIVKFVRGNITLAHEVFVCEMGARRVGEIKEICDLVNPLHAVITAVGEQHLETFRTLENVRRTKFELAEAAKPEGMVFLNGDNAAIREYDLKRKHLYYGLPLRSSSN